ncbi:hypothetical protein EYF80_052453 [Liparis tanakae]|uniref:Uncharacterized protein n=1 Tax=Liparis tanakae TaxID=230148 RepID=A0A4Z2F8P5_9TELE|nr:hypothetical protein EYF80_052453 [Liparis tanakae]
MWTGYLVMSQRQELMTRTSGCSPRRKSSRMLSITAGLMAALGPVGWRGRRGTRGTRGDQGDQGGPEGPVGTRGTRGDQRDQGGPGGPGGTSGTDLRGPEETRGDQGDLRDQGAAQSYMSSVLLQRGLTSRLLCVAAAT